MTTRDTIVMIGVRRLPEGVWLSTSDAIPGLIVETDTRDAAVDLAPSLARELLADMGRPAPEAVRFAFMFEDA
jgi:hypothetical protein